MERDITELKEFNKTFQLIINTIAPEESLSECAEVYQRLREVIEYNVLKGKKTRGLIVVTAFKKFSQAMNKTVTEEELTTARILGWILEILQAFALMIDDLADQSITRRGQMCWYKKVGTKAILDARLIEQETHHILRIFVSHKPYYSKIMDSLHEIMRLTSFGQLMDILSTRRTNQRLNLQSFTESRLETIYKYKTSYYTFLLPIKLAMYLSSLDQTYFDLMEQILVKTGHLYQMQDDFLDCFGDPTVTGKVGTDIAEGKCCWPVVTALQLCNNGQKQILEDNYGLQNEDNVRAIQQLYNEINLIDIYRNSEDMLLDQINAYINDIKSENLIIAQMLTTIVAKLKKRKV